MPLRELVALLCAFTPGRESYHQCPLCVSPTLSFRLVRNVAANRFECRVCGGGDVVNFLQRLLRLNAPMARRLWLELAVRTRALLDRDREEYARSRRRKGRR